MVFLFLATISLVKIHKYKDLSVFLTSNTNHRSRIIVADFSNNSYTPPQKTIRPAFMCHLTIIKLIM